MTSTQGDGRDLMPATVPGGGVAITMYATGLRAYSITEQQLDNLSSNDRALNIGLASACATALFSALLYLLTDSSAGREIVWGMLGTATLGLVFFGFHSIRDVLKHRTALSDFKSKSVQIEQSTGPSLTEVIDELRLLRRTVMRERRREEGTLRTPPPPP